MSPRADPERIHQARRFATRNGLTDQSETQRNAPSLCWPGHEGNGIAGASRPPFSPRPVPALPLGTQEGLREKSFRL
jgi:hypothetical protein